MTEDEMAGWHHWLDGHESEWTPGDGDEQGGLACCDSWGCKESDMTERLNWTEELVLNEYESKMINVDNYQFSCSVVSESLPPHGLQHARLPCPSPTPAVYSNSCPLSRWCHPTISSSAVPFSSCLQSFPASGSFPMSQFLHQVAKVLEFQLLCK